MFLKSLEVSLEWLEAVLGSLEVSLESLEVNRERLEVTLENAATDRDWKESGRVTVGADAVSGITAQHQKEGHLAFCGN